MHATIETEEPFGAWVLKERETLGISRKALSRKLDVSSEYIRTIELGKRTPSATVRVALEAALSAKGDLVELINTTMIHYGTGEPEFAKELAAKIIKAGYRKFI